MYERDQPEQLLNVVDGREVPTAAGETFAKVSPVTGLELGQVARSRAVDVAAAVAACKRAQPGWSATTPVKRGAVLFDVAIALRERREDVARIVSLETGKSRKDALGEVGAAVSLGLFMAGEGQRMFGRVATSGVEHRHQTVVREPIGVAGLIIASNTPIANVAWKVFPALVCGNTAVLKAAEDTPGTAVAFSRVALAAGLPPGVLQIVHGFGAEAGAPLVADADVGVVSFTGSTAVGREIGRVAGERLARLSLELGGKNALVVCDDADLALAVRWSLASAFSNAGQRCAAASRIIVVDAVYDRFRELLLEGVLRLKVGVDDDDDLGPVINVRQMERMLSVVGRARGAGARVLTGGERLTSPRHQAGCFVAPTVVEGASADAEISRTELFGPITCLYRARGFDEAVALANDSPYGLTACIHTRSVHRAMRFAELVKAGVVVVNGGTHGSEPHMPFGGVKGSGNGSREPGPEALDVYSERKNVCIAVDPSAV